MFIDLVLLVILNMTAHDDYGLAHEEHEQPARQRQPNDHQPVLHKDHILSRLLSCDDPQYPVGPMPYYDTLVGSKNSGQGNEKQSGNKMPLIPEKKRIETLENFHLTKLLLLTIGFCD